MFSCAVLPKSDARGDHHRHRHVDAGHLVAGDVIDGLAGRQQPAGLRAHRVGEEQIDAGETAIDPGDLGGDKRTIGAEPQTRARRHAGVGVEDVDLERVAGGDRLDLAGVQRPERQRRGHVAAVHAPVHRRLVGCELGEGADDALPLGGALHAREEHLVAGGNDPPQPGDLLVARARAGERQPHQVTQQFLAQVLLARRPVFGDHQPGGGAATHVEHGKFDDPAAQPRRRIE